jgi:NTP pyrophosphatase (non-canonical NTP hydrolase)
MYVTDKTVTFNCTKENLKKHLTFNPLIELAGRKVDVSDKIDSIYTLATNSDYVKGTCFVYRKSFDLVVNADKKTVYDNIRDWARERGIYEKGNPHTQYVKLQEEAGELAKALLKNDMPEIKDAIGDMIVVLTNLSELLGLKVEDCIDSAYDVIKNRKGKMSNGTFVKDEK